MTSENTNNKKSFFYRSLDMIEWGGNKLPHPAIMFASFAFIVLLLSALASSLNFFAHHPTTGKEILPVNLLNSDGIRKIFTSLVSNFTGFAPLGTVLVALLGVGVAEGTGLLSAVIRLFVISAPRKLITLVIVFTGVMSNAASEAGYVILIPLAGVIFLALGRHPLAGMAAAFAGVSGGYSANLVLGTVDPLLAGISQEAAKIINPNYIVNPACNWYFMSASTFLLTLLGAWVTEKIVEPRLGKYSGEADSKTMEQLSDQEKRGIKFALFTSFLFFLLLAFMVVPESGILRDPATKSILHSPFLTGIVAVIFLMFLLPGIAYGIVTKTLRNDADMISYMSKSMGTLAGYIVLVFFAAQFVAFFNWTNLGLILAVKGSEFLKEIGLTGIPLMIVFIVLSATMNLFMGSASAKWAIMAPVFIPMFMLVGYTPELTQCVYRIGDSVTNIITPMMSYFALIVAFIQRYKADAGLGTIIAMMLPYSIVFLVGWAIMLMVWISMGIPVGPGAGLFLQ